MPRIRYPRPTVKLWTGKSGKRYWQADWHQGPKHRLERWPAGEFTKREAQKACDALIRDESGVQSESQLHDQLREFWDRTFFPVLVRRLALNSRANYQSAWRKHIEPALGKLSLRDVRKHDIEVLLGRMADAGHGHSLVKRVLVITHELFEEAVANHYVESNPARNIKLPRCKPNRETAPLTEAQIQAIFDATEGRDRLMWRILFLTGCRLGELFALRQDDLLEEGLRIDESATWGRAGSTKNRKTRVAPIPSDLRQELLGWIAGLDGPLLFPTVRGAILRPSGDETKGILTRARKAVNMPKLTFRQARTTFATLYRGDPIDLQDILGHYDARITMETYRKRQQGRQQASVEELDSRLRKVVAMPKRESA